MTIGRKATVPAPLVGAAVVLYAVVLVLVVLGPWGWDLNRTTVRLYVFFRSDVPVAPAGALPEHYGAMLNVLLFVPMGAALVRLGGWVWWRVVLLVAVSSSTIEIVQGLWLARDASWTDVLTNTLGGLLGAVAVSLLAPDPQSAGRPEERERRP